MAVSVSEPGVRPILAEAVDLARRALRELQPDGVGEHLGVTAENECAATHHFAATLSGYRGWQWAVVVAAPPEADRATVSESALLPGPDALVTPEFVPWDQRVRPGDLAPGDLLAPQPNDARLVPGYLVTGDPVVDEIVEELGLGRPQVLSREGREEAAERWFAGYGPETEMARAAPSTCRLCGFFVPLAGSLRAAYGVCANAMGADGHVVHAEYGCGAHSDTELPTGGGSPLYEAYDDAAVELIAPEELGRPQVADAESGAAELESGAETTTGSPIAEVATGFAERESAVAESESSARVIRGVESAAASMRQAAHIGRQKSEFVNAFAETAIDPAESAVRAAGSPAAESDAADAGAGVNATSAASASETAVGPAESSSAAEYHDAWSVSAVRVRQAPDGASGASEQS